MTDRCAKSGVEFACDDFRVKDSGAGTAKQQAPGEGQLGLVASGQRCGQPQPSSPLVPSPTMGLRACDLKGSSKRTVVDIAEAGQAGLGVGERGKANV